MPVGVVPRQTRDLEPHDDARVSHAHIGDQTLKTFPPCCRRARLALIVVDDDNLVISPAQSDGATTQSVLTFRAFHILHDLPHGGLPDIQIRTSLKMVRLNFKRFIHVIAPEIAVGIAMAAKRWITVLCSLGAFQFGGREPACRSDVRMVVAARAQPHMPTWRKSISPERASGGKALPRAAARRVS